jgi:hypothetical protein
MVLISNRDLYLTRTSAISVFCSELGYVAEKGGRPDIIFRFFCHVVITYSYSVVIDLVVCYEYFSGC